jgi:hypothetical protein
MSNGKKVDDQAISCATRYGINKGCWGLSQQGIRVSRKGQFDQAIADYNKTIEMHPGYAVAYYNREEPTILTKNTRKPGRTLIRHKL